MENLESKKIRLLGRWLLKNAPIDINNPLEAVVEATHLATSIISLLDEIEQAHWTKMEELNNETHVGEDYNEAVK